jgi:hypothetical protein
VEKKNNYLYQEYTYKWKIQIFIQNQMQMEKTKWKELQSLEKGAAEGL